MAEAPLLSLITFGVCSILAYVAMQAAIMAFRRRHNYPAKSELRATNSARIIVSIICMGCFLALMAAMAVTPPYNGSFLGDHFLYLYLTIAVTVIFAMLVGLASIFIHEEEKMDKDEQEEAKPVPA